MPRDSSYQYSHLPGAKELDRDRYYQKQALDRRMMQGSFSKWDQDVYRDYSVSSKIVNVDNI